MKTLRSYLADLTRQGELLTIGDEVDWDLQASGITAMAQKTGGPAVQFTNVKGYPGLSLVGNLLSGPGYIFGYFRERRMQGRIALGLGLPKDTYYDDLIETMSERKVSPVRGVGVDSGPVQEVIVEKDEIDLDKFPIPRLHDGDGGRYLTSHVVMVRDPETGSANWGVYRLMLRGKNELVLGVMPGLTSRRHIQRIYQDKYAKRHAPMPFAVAIGVPPSMLLTAAMHTPEGTEEVGIAGGLMLEPIPLIKGRLGDTMVPADVEMVLEGHVYPGVTAEEGPFALISRYSEKGPGMVLKVESIMHRKNPILPFVMEGVNVSDSVAMYSVLHSQEIYSKLLAEMVPVRWVTLPVEGKLNFGIVSLRTHAYAGIASRVATKIFAMSPFVRWLLVLDGDVSSEDLITALNDMNMKAHPRRGWHVFPNKTLGATANQDPALGLGSTVYVDAMWRVDRPSELIPRRVSFETSFPPELQDRVIRRWNEDLKITPQAWKARI